MCEDDEGNVWAGTFGGGLNRVQPSRFQLLADDARWAATTFGSVTVDSSGDVWVSNQNGLRRLHRGQTEVMNRLPDWPKKTTSVCADRKGHIWIAAGAALWRATVDGDEAPALIDAAGGEAIRVLFLARDDSLWVGRDQGVVERYVGDKKSSFRIDQPGPRLDCAAITEDKENGIWIGTDTGEVLRLSDGKTTAYGVADGLPRTGIRVLHADAEGDLWIGTGGAGLIVRHGDRFHRITEADGLPDGVLSQLLEDGEGYLWFGSRRGLFRIRKASLLDRISGRAGGISPLHFGRSDGVSGISALSNYSPNAWKSADGKLWFYTRRGLVTTDPAKMSPPMPGVRVYVERLLADGRAIESEAGKVPPGTKRIDIHFTAPTFTAPDRLHFRYRLEGVDSGWIEAGEQRLATYSTLRPGRYRFEVMASRGDAQWTAPAAGLLLDVLPAWWETWTARIAGSALALFGLIAGVRYGSHRRLTRRLEDFEQQQRIERERTRIARDLHDDLGASLTQATMMAEELGDHAQDPELLKAQSRQVADQVRSIARDLDAVVWSTSPKNDSMSSLCSYICQFSTEFFRASRIRCLVDVPSDLPAAELLPETRHHVFMVAKEAMNNVLKHSGATQVEVSMRVGQTDFELAISDNGRGFDPQAIAEAERNGLRNMASRLEELGGSLQIESGAGGTCVRMRLSLQTLSNA